MIGRDARGAQGKCEAGAPVTACFSSSPISRGSAVEVWEWKVHASGGGETEGRCCTVEEEEGGALYETAGEGGAKESEEEWGT